MPVIVPSAPDVSEGSRLHEDAGSVSTFVPIMLCTTERLENIRNITHYTNFCVSLHVL